MLRDLHYAVRSLRKAPAFTLIAAVTLAIGIGANAAMLGLFDAILLRPPAGVADPARMVRFEVERAGRPGEAPSLDRSLSYGQFTAIRDSRAPVEGVVAYASSPLRLGSGEVAEEEPVILASGAYFALLGVGMELGQPITAAHDSESAPEPVAVLSYDYWQTAFGGSRSVLGQPVTIAGQSLTIIGVAERGFVGMELGAPAAWVPLSLAPSLGYERSMITSPFVSWLSVVARLSPAATPQQVEPATQSALLAAAEAGATAPPPTMRGGMPGGARIEVRMARPGGGPAPPGEAPPPPRVRASAIGGAGLQGSGDGPPVQVWYLAVTAAVLLIACANVANLLLARGVYREHDLAVRASLGATTGEISRMLLAEALVLAALGAVLGVLIAWATWRLLPVAIELPPLPPFIGARNLALLAALAFGTVLIFGLAPMVRLARPNLMRLMSGGSTRFAARSRGRSLLVVLQFALSVVLIVGAGLFIRSFQEVQGLDLGYDRENLYLVSAQTSGSSWTPERVTQFWDVAQERARALPGVTSTSLGTTVPFATRMMMPFRGEGVEDQGDSEPTQTDMIGEGFFETLGISIVAGRAIDATDGAGSQRVAVISESFAREDFGGASPIGRCISTGGPDCITVVGVAEDAHFGELTDETPRFVYQPIAQRPPFIPSSVMHVRLSGDPAESAANLRREVTALAGEGAQIEVRPLSELVEPQVAPWRGAAALLSVFGAIGIMLATIGLYGVVSFLVAKRTREIGIRLALGAARKSVMRMVLTDASKLVAGGAVIGVIAALAAGRAFSAALFGVGSFDPIVVLATLAILGTVGVLAALAPARRASGIDPLLALRKE